MLKNVVINKDDSFYVFKERNTWASFKAYFCSYTYLKLAFYAWL